jgi:hypothetical protein
VLEIGHLTCAAAEIVVVCAAPLCTLVACEAYQVADVDVDAAVGLTWLELQLLWKSVQCSYYQSSHPDLIPFRTISEKSIDMMTLIAVSFQDISGSFYQCCRLL